MATEPENIVLKHIAALRSDMQQGVTSVRADLTTLTEKIEGMVQTLVRIRLRQTTDPPKSGTQGLLSEMSYPVRIEIRQPDDYREVVAILERHDLRPSDEQWDPWLPGLRRQVIFIFDDESDANQAAVVLSDFLAA
jgi:hypothetical protein